MLSLRDSRITLSAIVLGEIGLLFLHLYNVLLLKPMRLRSRLPKQGFKGPSSSFLLGNITQQKAATAKCQHMLVPCVIGLQQFLHILRCIDTNMV